MPGLDYFKRITAGKLRTRGKSVTRHGKALGESTICKPNGNCEFCGSNNRFLASHHEAAMRHCLKAKLLLCRVGVVPGVFLTHAAS